MTTPTIKTTKGIMLLSGYTSNDILGLLAKRHVKDVFIPECKNGETWGARDLLKLDAWVLQRTYSPLTTIGYEIKVSRQDFEQDQKWIGYLDLCHLFFFICPAGMIRSTDLPHSVGLIWVSSTGTLHIKKKPERKEPNPASQNRLLIYALMTRSKIVANMYDNGDVPIDPLTQIRNDVTTANNRKELAYFVKGHIREYVDKINDKAASFESREACIKDFENRLKELGIIWDSNNNSWEHNNDIRNQIDVLTKHIDFQTIRTLEGLSHAFDRAVAELKPLLENSGQKERLL